MLDLRQFAVLDAIARTGSLAAAARDLHYGQPTVSHHLRALERHLDTKLVERSANGAVLTHAGDVFLAHARAVQERLRVAEDEIAQMRDHGQQLLRIGTFESAGARLLPEALAKLGAGTAMRVELVEGEPLGLMQQLLDGALHCALLYDYDGDTTVAGHSLRQQTLELEPFKVLLAADHPLADDPELDLADLAETGWIRSRSPLEASERALMSATGAAGYEPKTLLYSEDYSLIHAFVSAGIGAALVVPSVVDGRRSVVAKTTVQDLGMRRVRFVSAVRDGALRQVVDRLEALLMKAAGVSSVAESATTP
ncbi:LysR family transcriptional regulator [Gulosibacter bifidus]|uniref:LysR family transcriptional regulator n=1 Tax=Gulosibacter bifidus TaxID=272239 RepID=A0ABW5RKU6_9MICO|nr:LysR family transcriptional regulator [Gulosibacter bifidus]